MMLAHPPLGLNLIRTVIGRFLEVAGGRQPLASERACA
jgi:hypothetical protein